MGVWGLWAETLRPGSSCLRLGAGTTQWSKSTALLTGRNKGAVWPVQVARRKAIMRDLLSGGVLLKVGVVKVVCRVVVEVIRSNPKAVEETLPAGSEVHLRAWWMACLAGRGGVVV